MKPTIRCAPALLLAAALLTPQTTHADPQSTSPGKNSVFASQSGSALDFIEFLATIQKGKRNQVLKLDVAYSVSGGSCGSAIQACISVVNVNDMPVEPPGGACGACTDTGCSVSGTFWLDLDTSGQAGEPLDIRVVLADGGTQCSRSMRGSLAAVLVKK